MRIDLESTIDMHGVQRAAVVTPQVHVEMRRVRGVQGDHLHGSRPKRPYPSGAGTLGYGDNWDTNNVVNRAIGSTLGLPEDRTFFQRPKSSPTPFERFNQKQPSVSITGHPAQLIGFQQLMHTDPLGLPTQEMRQRLPGSPVGRGTPKMSRNPRWN